MTQKIVIPVRCPYCANEFKVRTFTNLPTQAPTVKCPACHKKSELVDDGGYYLKPKAIIKQKVPSISFIRGAVKWTAGIVGICLIFLIYGEYAQNQRIERSKVLAAARRIAEPVLEFESKEKIDWDIARKWCNETPNAKENGSIFYKRAGSPYGWGCWNVYDHFNFLDKRQKLLAKWTSSNPQNAMKACAIKLYPFRRDVLYQEDLPKIKKWLVQERNRTRICLQTTHDRHVNNLEKIIADIFSKKSTRERVMDRLDADKSIEKAFDRAVSKSVEAANSKRDKNSEQWSRFAKRKLNPALREGRKVERRVAEMEAAIEAKKRANQYARDNPLVIESDSFSDELNRAAEKYLYAPQRRKAEKSVTIQSRKAGKGVTIRGAKVEYPSFKHSDYKPIEGKNTYSGPALTKQK